MDINSLPSNLSISVHIKRIQHKTLTLNVLTNPQPNFLQGLHSPVTWSSLQIQSSSNNVQFLGDPWHANVVAGIATHFLVCPGRDAQ